MRSKLDKLTLSTRITVSECINNFQLYTKQLEELGESYTTSKTVSIFFDQISDPHYTSTKELCIEPTHFGGMYCKDQGQGKTSGQRKIETPKEINICQMGTY